MNPDCFIAHVLLRAELDERGEDRYSIDDFANWPKDEVSGFLASGLLVPADPDTIVECDACYEGHYEEVGWVHGPPGSLPRAYIACPLLGRIRVKPERLERWRFSLPGLAALIVDELGTAGNQEIVAGRAWSLGHITVDDEQQDLCLGLGLGWMDGHAVIDLVARWAAHPIVWFLVDSRRVAHGARLANATDLSDVVRFADSRFHLAEDLFAFKPGPSLALPYADPSRRTDGTVSDEELRQALGSIGVTSTRLFEIVKAYRETDTVSDANLRVSLEASTMNNRVSEIRTKLAKKHGKPFADRIVPYRRPGMKKG
jgi:hypothetical protein